MLPASRPRKSSSIRSARNRKRSINACQSFYSGPSFSWNGYGNPYSVYQRYVWARSLQGDWSLGWFCGNTFYSPYDAFLPQAQWVADLTRPLAECGLPAELQRATIVYHGALTEPYRYLTAKV